MNTKKIKLHDHHYGSPLCDPQLLYAGTTPRLSFHAGLGSSVPQAGSWLYEHISTPRSVLATQGSCVGFDPSAFFATEHLLGTARLDCARGSTTLPAMAALETVFGQSPETDQLYRSVDSPLLHDDSVMTNHIPPLQLDAAEEILKLPLQQQDRLQGLFENASPARLLGGEHKIRSISPHVGGSTLLPATEAPSVQSTMENSLLRSCNISASAIHAGKVTTIAPRQAVPSKTRITWTQDLHDRFVDCVNQLGGADKATPKGILKLMNPVSLTIYHIKSHLQKYRITKYMTASSEAKKGKRAAGTDLQNLDPNTGTQIKEALRVQLDVQKRLYEQIEIHTNLQLRIEAQGKKLQKMLEEQLKASRSMLEPWEELQGVGAASPFNGEQQEDAFDDAWLLQR